MKPSQVSEVFGTAINKDEQALAKLLPANAKGLRWTKYGGYAGEKSIETFKRKLQALGWKPFANTSTDTPDGSVTRCDDAWRSPDGKWHAECSKYYGHTKSDNHYSITISPVRG
jgi:hypothetical protein